MQIVDIQENKNNIVKKHQELVRNARYGLGDIAIKTLSILISMIKTSDTEFTEYTIKLSDFKELTNATGNEVFKYVDKMTNDLMSNPFWIGSSRFNWVTLAQYERGSSIVTFEIHRHLKPYLLELKNKFLQYNIANILVLKSAYVIRLYELCKDHFMEETRYKNKNSVAFDMKIDRLRELFNIPDSYQYSSHIKKHILNKAVKQLKEKTDIQISYTEQKIGRKVDRIIITVKENNKGSNDYLSSKRAFVAWVREKYKPNVEREIYPTIFETNQGRIRVDANRKIYLSDNSKNGNATEYDHDQANKLWSWLYEEVKSGKIKLNKIVKSPKPIIKKPVQKIDLDKIVIKKF